MKQRFLKAAGAMLLSAATVSSYGQYLGSTPPDAKMLPNASPASSAMSSIYSPSLFDGTANITIPIYNYDNFGVSLTYNTKGILLDEVSSNAGLHWNIVAEPNIERTVKGFPDEFTYKTDPSTNLQVGANQYYSKFHGRLAASFETGSQQTDPETFRDEESDEFQVSLGGTSFSFVIGKNRGIYTIPYKNITVTLLSNGVPYESAVHGDTLPDPLSMQFNITDEQGNSYLFVKGNYVHSSITYSQVGRQNALLADPTIGDPQYMINRWVVKDITLADGRKIHYNYTRTSEGSADSKSWLGYDWGSSSRSAEPDRVADIYNWISDITYPNNTKVTFIYDTQHRRCDWGYATSGSPTNYPLSEIQVGSATSLGNCLRYKLYQHYDVTAADNTSQTVPEAGPCASMSSGGNSAAYRAHRLILDSLNLLSCDGTAQEPYYAFTYNGVHMPWRFRGGRDWFGYYNGKSPGGNDPDLSVPYHTPNPDPSNPNPTAYGIDRSSDINYMQAGILTSVKNASGGVVGFVYEAHSGLTNAYGSLPASDPFFMAANADDGLRLHFINETDPFNVYGYRVTEFTYAGGQRFLPGGYFHSPYSSDALSNTTMNLIFSNNFLTAHQMVNGANHGYATVTVTTKNSGGQMLGKKIVTFTNIQDATVSQPRYYRSSGSKQFFEFPYADKQYLRDWELGLPLTESSYDNLGNLQQVTTNRYNFQLDATSAASEFGNTKKSFVVTDKDQYIYTAPSNGLGTGSMFYPCTAITDDYMPYRGKSLLLSTTVKKYVNASSFIPDSTNYAYDDHDNLKTISTWNSKGEEIQTINYYNYDIQAASGGSFSPLTGLEKLVATQRWKRLAGVSGSLPENGVLLDGYFTAYAAQGGPGSYANIRNQALYNLRSGVPLTYSQYLGSGSDNTTAKKVQAAWSGLNISGYRNTSNVTQFDVKGNPLETQLLGLDQYKAMIWDTVSGQKLAEAANCRYGDIAYSSFEYQYDIYNSNTNLGYINGPGYFQTDHVTGSRSLLLGTATSVVGTQDLSPGKEYILSFWSQGSNPAVYIGSTAISLPASPAAQKGSWSNYILHFTPSGTGQRIKISGTASNCTLDEVRLHPASAVMQSWTYMPLYGMSSATDATGRITYYEYDPMGRQDLVRDQEGNILQKTQYTIGGADQ